VASRPPTPERPDVLAASLRDTVTPTAGVPTVRLPRALREEPARSPDALPRGLSPAEALAFGLVETLLFDDAGELFDGLILTLVPCLPPVALALECGTDAFELDRPPWPSVWRAAPATVGTARAAAMPTTTIAFFISIHLPRRADHAGTWALGEKGSSESEDGGRPTGSTMTDACRPSRARAGATKTMRSAEAELPLTTVWRGASARSAVRPNHTATKQAKRNHADPTPAAIQRSFIDVLPSFDAMTFGGCEGPAQGRGSGVAWYGGTESSPTAADLG